MDGAMTAWKNALLSLPVVAVALGALSVGLILLGRYWGLGGASLFLIVIPLALAIVYIRWYQTLPFVPAGAPVGSPSPYPLGAASEEPFEDPVEEADQFDQASKRGPPPEEVAVVEDDSTSKPPSAP